MRSELTESFRKCFAALPNDVKARARKNYRLWRNNPEHPGLEFKKMGKRKPVYSVRVGLGWRALGVVEGSSIIWFWIGSHAEYDKLLAKR